MSQNRNHDKGDCYRKTQYGGREIEILGEIDLSGEIYFAYKEGILVERSYVEDEGRLFWRITSPKPMDIVFTNHLKARYTLINTA